MFKILDPLTGAVAVEIDGQVRHFPPGTSAALGLLLCNLGAIRYSPVSDAPRAPYCLMGVCHECLAEINGCAGVRACMVEICHAMSIKTGRRP
jgi:hypothetical protein